MISAESFWTSSLRLMPEGERLTRILAAAITAVEPGAAMGRFVHRDGDMLTISGRTYDLQSFRRVVLLGMGKASLAMTQALAAILGSWVDDALVVKKHSPFSTLNFQLETCNLPMVLEGGHPVPDERSLEAGKKVIELVSSLQADVLLFCLISGGGSALVTAPVEGVSLEDIQMLTSTLLACGARIDEINSLRRRLDLVKGGGIAKMANGATIISLILSDVVGNPLEAIASGPTAPDPANHSEALSILSKYGLEDQIPLSINHALHSSPGMPKPRARIGTATPDDPIFEKVQNVVVGSNLLAAQAALKQAEEEGFHAYLLRTDLQGEARQAAFELATFLRQARLTGDPVPPPACIVAGGETTVTLRQSSGQAMTGIGGGGRNTELALAAVSELADFPSVVLVTLATDGEDGPTDAAGAVVTGETFRRAAKLGLHPGDFLERHDSYSFFSALDDLLKPGPTGTNVNDLVFLFVF
jgi:glycerate 2-kinase